jgi:hypothetical protein
MRQYIPKAKKTNLTVFYINCYASTELIFGFSDGSHIRIQPAKKFLIQKDPIQVKSIGSSVQEFVFFIFVLVVILMPTLACLFRVVYAYSNKMLTSYLL